MNTELCLIEVFVERFDGGDEEYLHHLQDITLLAILENGKLQITDEIQDFSILDLEERTQTTFLNDPLCEAYYPEAKITQTTWGFTFNFIGESNDNQYSCGLEWEASEVGYDEIFAEDLDVLKALAEKKFLERENRGLDPGKCQRIVALWEYATWKDSYYEDPETDCNLIGPVDLQQLKQSLPFLKIFNYN